MDFKENKLTFKQNIEGVGNIRYSHAPLFTEKVYQKRFLEGVEDKDAELTKQEVREKCFQVLGYLEEFQRVVNNPQANAAEENKVIQGMETEDDLLALLLDEGMQEEELNIEAVEGREIEAPDSPKTKADSQRIYITKQIRELFSYKQVREFFLENLREEAKKYGQARPKLRKVAKMEFAQNGALRKMIQLYLQSKRTYGKLVQSASDNIAKLEAMRKKAEEKEKSERQSANEQERGFLEVQKLLQFKHQIKEKGFALTHTRKQLVAQISEHVLAGRKVFLVGSTGTGKTELALYVSDTVSGKHEMVSWHEGTTPRDLFGYRELWTDKDGNTVSGTKAGPVTKAVDTQTGGATVIHDEYTAGTTRSQIAAKAFMNAKKGQEIHIPGFNGDVFEVSENFAEIFTGNPKDEKTQAREDMDPAILRMLTGLKIDYMPASEMNDVILANLIEDNGVLKLSREEVEIIKKLCNAAELMHMFHNREFAEITNSLGSTSHEFTTLKGIFGGNIEDARLDKHFLDPGTLFSMFSDFDFTRAKSGDLKKHLEERLSEFLDDPKTTVSEEKQLMRKILELCSVLKD
ncbi:AAA domain-containing protein [bacterium]|jgi:MoxR-like ATPase|nr:AAA domain-containing protein [bacterium]